MGKLQLRLPEPFKWLKQPQGFYLHFLLLLTSSLFFSTQGKSTTSVKIALLKSQRESKSTSNQTTVSTDQTSEHKDTTNLLSTEQELKFVTKIKETTEELQVILDTLRDALHPNWDTLIMTNTYQRWQFVMLSVLFHQ